jgi:hypothetical protein
MIRRLLKLLTAVSALLCVSLLVIAACSVGEWGMSLSVSRLDLWDADARYRRFSVHAHNGQFAWIMSFEQHIGMNRANVEATRANDPGQWRVEWVPKARARPSRTGTLRDRFGFTNVSYGSAPRAALGRLSMEHSYRYYGLPWWFVAAGPAALPTARALAWARRSRRRPSNRCPRCGYDLTGNVSGVCPECGKEVA